MRIPLARWVAPFGDPGINDRSHLPRAFRSVPRPSSPLSAKASTRCPYLRLSATPNGKDQISENRFQMSEVRTADATNSPLRRHCGILARPYGRAVSRYGHTTRFFTIVHQQMPQLPQQGMQQACSGSSCRVFVTAPGAGASRGLPQDGFGANHCRRAGPEAARDESWRFHRWWR